MDGKRLERPSPSTFVARGGERMNGWTVLSGNECRMLELILQGEPPPDRLAMKADGAKFHVVTRHGQRRYFWLITPTEDGSMLSLEKVDPEENVSPVTVDTDDTVQ